MLKRTHHPATPPCYAVCFDPVTIAVVAGAATAYSAYSSYQSGKEQQKLSNLQASILDQNAEAARKAAAADASQFARDESRAAARLRALVGGTGVTTAGTPITVEEDRTAEAELQRLKILHGGEVSASQLTAQAGLERTAGRFARTRGQREAFSRLLTGGARVGAYAYEKDVFG